MERHEDMGITTWLLKSVGFTGYVNAYLSAVEAEYKARTVAQFRPFMVTGALETGYPEISRACKTAKRADLIRILASYPHVFGVSVPDKYRLAHHNAVR